MSIKIGLAVCLVLVSICQGSVVIPGSDNIGLLFFGSSQIAVENYYNSIIAVHKKLNSKLWVVISNSSSNIKDLEDEVTADLKMLVAAGMTVNETTPFYFVGHSSGGRLIQEYVLNSQLPVKVAGLILEGFYVTRNNYDKINNLPVLTIGAELDGLTRITRLAEADYFDVKENKKEFNRMTLIVEGMNHFQFCANGDIPSEIAAKDFKPEISNDQALEQTSDIVSSFIKVVTGIETDYDVKLLRLHVNSTVWMLNPIIEAYHLEASERLFKPCNTLVDKVNCTFGCPWSGYAQKAMAGDTIQMFTSDTFHAVPHQPNPIEFPAIHNNCSNQPTGCILNVTTVSQFVYSTDENLGPRGALEIRTKLMSRQAVLLAATGTKYAFNETDGSGYRCAEINNMTIQWAINNVPEKTRERYLKHGRQLRTGRDVGPLNIGPLWIYHALEYKNTNEVNGNYTTIYSATLNTPVDFWIKSAAAFHYCKILSPARATEWIYFDSLIGQAM